MTFWIFVIVFCVHTLFLSEVEGCSFPSSWNGTYYSSTRGDLVINTTTIKDFNTSLIGPLDYSCFMNSGSLYILRSDLFTLHNALHRAYFCLEITELSPASIMYRHKTSQNAQAYNERMKVYPAISSVSLLDVCNITPETTSWEVLVQQGSESTAASNCPDAIRGVYNYTVTESSTTTCGLNTSSLDVCTNTTSPTVNMTLCGTNVAYSAGGLLQCIFSQVINSYSYSIVLNLDTTTDEATTYRFTCLVSQIDGEFTYVSQYPQTCRTSQTPTYAPSGGATLVLLPSRTCPSGKASSLATDASFIATSVIFVILQAVYCFQ